MADNFAESLDIIRRWEGGWSDHPDDKGGLTRWGISLRFLKSINRDFSGDGVVDGRDLTVMTHEDAEGILGPKTMEAVDRSDKENLLLEFMARRILHYSSLSIFVTFGRGWIRRALDVHARARAMI